jgi:hypothetical protein
VFGFGQEVVRDPAAAVKGGGPERVLAAASQRVKTGPSLLLPVPKQQEEMDINCLRQATDEKCTQNIDRKIRREERTWEI